ncbi:hypothetical protein HA402_013412 [Bradysia odoriphaga]|nr:hypothetical protein HA402_013412 [Bradysia odoriphaga]
MLTSTIKKMLSVKYVFLLLSITQLSYAFPDGADPQSCRNQVPVHPPHQAQTSPAPFTVTTSVPSVSPGQQISVFITRTNTATVLRGFMIEARSAAGAILGQFLPTAGMRLAACTPVGSTATHSNADQRVSITLTWVPPPTGFVGNVVFHATAVQDFATFWTGITSPPLAVNP